MDFGKMYEDDEKDEEGVDGLGDAEMLGVISALYPKANPQATLESYKKLNAFITGKKKVGRTKAGKLSVDLFREFAGGWETREKTFHVNFRDPDPITPGAFLQLQNSGKTNYQRCQTDQDFDFVIGYCVVVKYNSMVAPHTKNMMQIGIKVDGKDIIYPSALEIHEVDKTTAPNNRFKDVLLLAQGVAIDLVKQYPALIAPDVYVLAEDVTLDFIIKQVRKRG